MLSFKTNIEIIGSPRRLQDMSLNCVEKNLQRNKFSSTKALSRRLRRFTGCLQDVLEEQKLFR